MIKTISLTVIEVARNVAKYVDRSHDEGVTFVLLQNGMPVARLIPEYEKVCTGRELAEVLAGIRLSAAEARAWYRDLTRARKRLTSYRAVPRS
jgi:antitoxin (DNA-binding transcriptional repressor) of toxin-antitoxin stability system